jgi:uncharacterized membrane protein YdbT with pleckstrin-like domain
MTTGKRGKSATTKKTQARGHWIVLMKGMLYTLIGTVMSIGGAETWQRFPGSLDEILTDPTVFYSWSLISTLLGTAAILFGVFDLIYNMVWLLTSKVIIKRDGIEWRTGFLNHQIEPISYARIESVALYRSLLARILNYGTLRIYGIGSGVITVPHIRKAKALSEFINKHKNTHSAAQPSGNVGTQEVEEEQ